MSRAVGILWLATLGMGLGPDAMLRAQEPPAHLALCINDDAARRFLDRVRYLVARGDSTAHPEHATVEVEEPACRAAAEAYAGIPHRQALPRPPFAIMVVRMDQRYYVQLADSPADPWDIALFDRRFQPLGTVGPP